MYFDLEFTCLCDKCKNKMEVFYVDGSYHETICIFNRDIDISKIVKCNQFKIRKSK